MDREQLLKQEIDKIVAYGKSKGSISEDDIMARLEHLNATAEDMEMVFQIPIMVARIVGMIIFYFIGED